jgi:hypothetical protein
VVPPPTAPQPLAPGSDATPSSFSRPQEPRFSQADGPSFSRAEEQGRSSPPHGQRRPAEPPRPPARAPEPEPEPAASVYRDTDEAADEAPAEDYGPDDPAYGPPDAAWYERRKREREAEREREEEEFLAEAAGETASSSRGAFEPLANRSGTGPAEPTGLDLLLNADDGADNDQDPLDRVKDMYLAAEAVSDADLDRRFEELLERQRKLISAYFTRSRPAMPDGIGDKRIAMSGDRQGQR